MSDLFTQLGINGSLLLAQVINFAILLSVLYLILYKPMIKMMTDRAKKIEDGLLGADRAEKKLEEIEVLKSEKLSEANKQAVAIISAGEKDARVRSQEIIKDAGTKGEALLEEARGIAERKKNEGLADLEKEAKDLLRDALAKAVEMNPSDVDEKLITQAAAFMKQTK